LDKSGQESKEIIAQRLQYIYFTLPIVITMVSYFTYLYVVEYHMTTLVYYIAAPLSFLTFIPLIYSRTKSYNVVAAGYLIITLLMVYTMIFLVGGVKAPGLFWMVLSPVFGGILWGGRGGYLGMGMAYLTFGIFWQLDRMGIYGPIVFDSTKYNEQKVVNFILLSGFAFAIFIYFLRIENKTKKKLYIKNEYIEMLIRILVHDVANSLGILKMHNKFVLEKCSGKCTDVSKHLIRSQNTLATLEEILNDIRTIKVLEDNLMSIKLEQVNLKHAISHAIENVGEKAGEKGVKIVFDAEKFSSFEVVAEFTLLSNQIFTNILTNAIKFSPQGGTIEINCQKTTKGVATSITDRGIGMPKEIIQGLSSITTKTNRPGTNNERGTGYGMPIAFRFVETMQGEIQVRSVEKKEGVSDHGTTITVTLNNPEQPSMSYNPKWCLES
jgi:signal transduction histidine kinase